MLTESNLDLMGLNPTQIHRRSRDRSVGTGWTSGFDSRQGLEIFLFCTASRPGPTQPPIQWVPGGGGAKGLSTHLHLVASLWMRGVLYLHSPIRLHGVQLSQVHWPVAIDIHRAEPSLRIPGSYGIEASPPCPQEPATGLYPMSLKRSLSF
jgi:hypothetical protein